MTTDDTKKILYGVSDFELIRTENGYFVDRTHLIPGLEKTPFAVFLRPRRFGKSLLVSILECYYDKLWGDRFDEIFGGTRIHLKPTKNHNSYLVLTLDFSAVVSTSGEVKESFNDYCMKVIDAFVSKHDKYLPEDTVSAVLSEKDCHRKLNVLSSTLKNTKVKIYVMIDEYDNFTNTILASEGLDAYNAICHGEGFFKQFFKELKAATTGTGAAVSRLFITGVSPVTLDDVTSGFNIADNISMEAEFADLLGFHREELREMLEYYASTGDFKPGIDVSMDTMLDWYNNYSFSIDSPVKVCNPTLVLGFVKHSISSKKIPAKLFDENLRTDYAKLRQLVTLNNRLNGNFHAIEQILADGGCFADVVPSFQAREMAQPDNFVSLLYYFGMIAMDGTYRGVTRLRIPNQTMRYFLNSFVTEGYSRACSVNLRTSELTRRLADLAYDGTWKPCMELVADIVRDCFASRDGIEGEKVVQADMTALLNVAANSFIVQSEYNANGGYADISLAPFLVKCPDMEYAVLIELKYLKKKDNCTPELLQNFRNEAAAQLTQYAADRNLARLWQLNSEGGRINLIRLAVVFQGGEMLLCEEV